MSRLVERLVGRPLTDEEKLTAGVVLTLTFMVFEGAFAIVAGSLAMLGDAAHMPVSYTHLTLPTICSV